MTNQTEIRAIRGKVEAAFQGVHNGKLSNKEALKIVSKAILEGHIALDYFAKGGPMSPSEAAEWAKVLHEAQSVLDEIILNVTIDATLKHVAAQKA